MAVVEEVVWAKAGVIEERARARVTRVVDRGR